jgi:threonine/homoserine/homoserine lactone efflux protein
LVQKTLGAHVSICIALVSFALTGALITVSPGTDSLLVLRTSIAAGPRSAAMAAAGTCVGLFVWALATAFGLSAVLAASTTLYQILKTSERLISAGSAFA